jgi:hypothetical protein
LHLYFAKAERARVPLRNQMALQVTVTPHNGSYDDDPILITTSYAISQRPEYVIDEIFID